MIPLTRELQIKLNHFTSNDGSAALEVLADALLEYLSNECVISEGVHLNRSQGAAQLAKWLKSLPKGLRDGSNATTSVGMG
jgi:hypothetical protein